MRIRHTSIFLAVVSVFLYGYTLPGMELNLFVGVLVLVASATLFTLSTGPLLIQRRVIAALVFMLAVGIVGIVLGRGSISSYLTQAFAISLVVISSTIIVAGGRELTAKIFPTYLELSFVYALIAIFELVLGSTGVYFEFLTPEIDYVFANVHRITGLAAEPAHYCFVMTPSVVAILICTLLGRPCMSTFKSVVIVMSYILTFSSVGFFVLSLVLLAFFFRRSSWSAAMAKIVLIAAVIGLFSIVPQINMRIVDTYSAFALGDHANVNLSSLTLYKNAVVTTRSAVDQPIFGAGLGGHEHNYYKYLPSSLLMLGRNLNEKDASSLFLRLISEFGLPFTALFYLLVIFFWTGFPDRRDVLPIYWKKLTSTAILLLIIAYSLRGGNYIFNAFPLFLILYYDVYRSLKYGDMIACAPQPAPVITRPIRSSFVSTTGSV
jgi:hypothetical protein